ncbi:MAG: hypothetical protein HY040_09360 [Planctomycetes bacterium]|nr:hypothetical protein [Planctomycetota bacterium]
MPDLKVNSREYKFMLQAGRFPAGEKQVLKAAGQFWRDATRIMGPLVLGANGDLNKVQDHRTIRFFDTSSQHLNRNSYIFRERAGTGGKSREMTLKFRHPDRYVSADRDMDAAGKTKGKTKFEEDIKPPFQQLYSFSTTVPVPMEQKMSAMKHVVQLFPGLKRALDGFADDEPLAVVQDFTAHEVVLGGASLYLGKRHNVHSSCVLVIWYDHTDGGGPPAVAEFSFKYGDRGEAYGGGTARRAYSVFQALQSQLDDWTDKDSKTKTAFVYG